MDLTRITDLPPIWIAIFAILQIIYLFIGLYFKGRSETKAREHKEELASISRDREKDRQEAGHTTSLIELAETSNEQRSIEARLNVEAITRQTDAITRQTEAITRMATAQVAQNTRQNEIYVTLEHSIIENTRAVVSMEESLPSQFAEMARDIKSLVDNATKQLDEAAEKMTQASKTAGKEDHEAMLTVLKSGFDNMALGFTQLERIETLLKAMQPPPEPKPPNQNVIELPTEADENEDENNNDDNTQEQDVA